SCDDTCSFSYDPSPSAIFTLSLHDALPISEETAQIIDAEVRRLIDEAYTSATQILTKKKKDWIALAEGLLEYETLSGDEIKQLLDRKSTRLNSSHVKISYAVFCLKKKKNY